MLQRVIYQTIGSVSSFLIETGYCGGGVYGGQCVFTSYFLLKQKLIEAIREAQILLNQRLRLKHKDSLQLFIYLIAEFIFLYNFR